MMPIANKSKKNRISGIIKGIKKKKLSPNFLLERLVSLGKTREKRWCWHCNVVYSSVPCIQRLLYRFRYSIKDEANPTESSIHQEFEKLSGGVKVERGITVRVDSGKWICYFFFREYFWIFIFSKSVVDGAECFPAEHDAAVVRGETRDRTRVIHFYRRNLFQILFNFTCCRQAITDIGYI